MSYSYRLAYFPMPIRASLRQGSGKEGPLEGVYFTLPRVINVLSPTATMSGQGPLSRPEVVNNVSHSPDSFDSMESILGFCHIQIEEPVTETGLTYTCMNHSSTFVSH